MDLDTATQELYRLAPSQFTAARDALEVRARQEGHPEIAASLKKLRRPSVGAWLANLLVGEQPNDIRHLIELGVGLRAPTRALEGGLIRQASKEKGDAISKLVRDALAKAADAGQSVSAAASHELEGTLEAAFADPQSAESLLGARLTSGLRYSGLGLGDQIVDASPSEAKGRPRTGARTTGAPRVAAERALKKASREAELADAAVEEARQAVARASRQLTRLRSAESLAVRDARDAHVRVSAARKNLGQSRSSEKG